MPKSFQQLNLEEFIELLEKFPFTRRIESVHMHHTWRPNHAQYKGHDSIVAMWEFHTQTQGWSDIAQHISIAPDGKIWMGRNWNQPPASAKGFNGNSSAGPFMFEMIGDFDQGKDPFQGAQKETVLRVIAHVQKRFDLEPETLRFHKMMSKKSCPGSALDHATVLREVAEVRKQIDSRPAATREAKPPPFEDHLRPVGRILNELRNAVPSTRSGDEGEGCDDLPKQEAEFDRTTAAPPEASRAARGEKLPPEMLRRLRPHVINLNLGRLSSTGEFQTSEADVDAIFEEHLQKWAEARPGQKLPIVFYAHGGLTSEQSGLLNADRQVEWWLENGAYPIHFVWETGLWETLGQILNPNRQRAIDWLAPVDGALERLAHAIGGVKIWSGMKVSAERAADKDGGARYAGRKLKEFCERPEFKDRVELHAVGHSAGSIFHAYFIPAALEEKAPAFRTLHFLAPAIRVDTFERQLLGKIGEGKGIGHLSMFTMARDFEMDDNCASVYHKSLLYLIYYALEPDRKTPILGLEESIRANPRLKRLFDLDRQGGGAGEVIWSVTRTGVLPPNASTSRRHGDFNEDAPTMESVGQRILGRVVTPFVASQQRGLGVVESLQAQEPSLRGLFQPGNISSALPPAPVAGPAASGRSSGAASGRGRKLALCVGIDNYPTAPLGGCANDAQEWRRTFQSLGFEEPHLLLNEEATRSEILGQLSGLLGSSRAGDVVAFQFSGHGTQLPDLDGDEAGGDTPDKDEALCPVDFADGRFVIDDDLAAVFDTIPAGVSVTVFADCCHSGSNTRLAVGPPPVGGAGRNVKKRFLPATEAMKQAHAAFRSSLGGTRGAAPRGAYDKAREVLFAACRSREVALESDGHGHFTTNAMRILASGIEGLTNAEFQARVVQAFGANAGQNPELHCASELRSRLLLAPIDGVAAGRTETGPSSPASAEAEWRGELARALESAAQAIRR
ncbi:MAG TPA: caspase family protein [Chthoniobacterales bacterium]|nr:caspase family protein [Chthoniobacterales bacterium]